MSVDQPIHTLFRKLERQLAKASAKAQPNNVHQLRTSIRRVETVLEELVPDHNRNQRKLLKELARLRRRAGRVRDLDVQIAALRALKVSEAPGHKTTLLRTLADIRAKREQKLISALAKPAVRETRKRLKRAKADLALLANHPDPLSLASRMFARVSDGQTPLTEELLHRYRVAGKRIRYIAELSGDHPQAQSFIARLEHMQDALGDWHDWLTLGKSVKKLVGPANSSNLPAALSNITRAKLREAMLVVADTKRALLNQPIGVTERRRQQAAASVAA